MHPHPCLRNGARSGKADHAPRGVLARLVMTLALCILTTPLLFSTTAAAVYPMPHQATPPLAQYPCDQNAYGDKEGCYSCSRYSGYRDSITQVRRAERSSRSEDQPSPCFGACNGSLKWCAKQPVLGNVTWSISQTASGGAGIQFQVEYDFADAYCMVTGNDSCLGAGCASGGQWPVDDHNVRLRLMEDGADIYDMPAIFESGVWLPTVGASCDGSSHTYTIQLRNCTNPAVTRDVTVSFPAPGDPACKPRDLGPCPPRCGPGSGGGQ